MSDTLTPRGSGCNLIVQNSAGKYLLQFRDGTPGISNPLTWGLFGGGLEPGETVLENASRELTEEIGITLPTEQFLLVGETIINGRREIGCRCLTPIEATEIILQEGAGFGYFTRDELDRLELGPLMTYFLDNWM